MRFLMMTTNDPNNPPAPPTPELYQAMGKLIEELSREGVLLATGGLDPHPTRIQSSGGKINVLDGPFTEAKEAVVGFALIEARSKEEAIEYSKRFWRTVTSEAGASVGLGAFALELRVLVDRVFARAGLVGFDFGMCITPVLRTAAGARGPADARVRTRWPRSTRSAA